MSIVFINGSPNKNGNTAGLAKELLKGRDYETLNLTDYRIGSYGQDFPDDQLGEVIAKIKESEVIVIGSPLYWHNICGSVRNMLDRFYGLVEEGALSGKSLYFLFQGAAPEKWMMEAGEYGGGSGKVVLFQYRAAVAGICEIHFGAMADALGAGHGAAAVYGKREGVVFYPLQCGGAFAGRL